MSRLMERLNKLYARTIVLGVPVSISIWTAVLVLHVWEGWPAVVAAAVAAIVSFRVSARLSHKWLVPRLQRSADWSGRDGERETASEALIIEVTASPRPESWLTRVVAAIDSIISLRFFWNCLAFFWQWTQTKWGNLLRQHAEREAARQRKAAEEAETRRLTEEAERKRLAEEAEKKRLAKQEAERLLPWLGIVGVSVNSTLARQLRLIVNQGVYVVHVQANSPAAEARLSGGGTGASGKALPGGDLIIEVDGKKVASMAELDHVVKSRWMGDVVSLTLRRDQLGYNDSLVVSSVIDQRTVRLRLARKPEGASTKSYLPSATTLAAQSLARREIKRTEAQRQQQSQQEADRRRQAEQRGLAEREAERRSVAEKEAQRQRVAEQRAERWETPPSIIPEKEMLEFLLDLSGYQAWCCGFANRMADGTVIKETSHFHLDHLDPKSKGGSNQITNRVPMCAKHNLRKSDRYVHLKEYRREIVDLGELKVARISDLVDLTTAYQKALDYYAKAQAELGASVTSSGISQARGNRRTTRSRPITAKKRSTR